MSDVINHDPAPMAPHWLNGAVSIPDYDVVEIFVSPPCHHLCKATKSPETMARVRAGVARFFGGKP